MQKGYKTIRSSPWIAVLFLVVLWQAWPAVAGVLVNEILAANHDNLLDEDGDSSDWIELLNTGVSDLNLTGFTLSDDEDDPGKWTFPEASIPAGGHLLIFASGKDRHLHANHWETVVDLGDLWRYRVNGSATPEGWREIWFDDGTWSSGPTGIGFGGGDDATEIPPCISVSCRINFTVAEPATVRFALLHVDYDDGFVAWLNGVEIARANIGGEGDPPWDQPADYEHDAVMSQSGPPERFEVASPATLLHTGDNVLAVELHNVDPESPDLTLIPFLTLGRDVAPSPGGGCSEHLQGLMPILHTNFKLAAEGEALLLSDAAGILIDHIQTGQMYADISLGRGPDGAPLWLFFPLPTPGAANGTDGFQEFTAKPEFSIRGGSYTGSLILSLWSPDSGAAIYYTTDGSDPDSTSLPWTGELPITSTTVIRARAFRVGALPSLIATHTYILNDPSTLPITSFVSDPRNLWDPVHGIFAAENIWNSWERPLHVEFWETGGEPVLAQDAGVKLFGGWSRTFPQKSLRLIARSGYGDGDFSAPLFPERPFDSFKQLVWRNSGNDWCRSMLRDGLMHRLPAHIDIDRLAYRPTRTYLNGEYWGILNLREHFDENYLASNHPVDPGELDIIKNYWELFAGSPDHYWNMITFLEENDPAEPENMAVIESLMDTDQFAEYVIWQVFYANVDWPGNNIIWWRPGAAAGRWRWVLYDTDFGLGLESDVHTGSLAMALEPAGPEWPNPPWSTLLLRRLMENGEFKRRFINRYADHLAGSFLPERTRAVTREMAAVIEPEIVRHYENWEHDPQEWYLEMIVIDEFLNNRPGPAREHLREQFDLGADYSLNLDLSPPGAGAIDLLAVSAASTWSGQYFIGNPVTLTARPAPGFRFREWSDGLLPRQATIEIDPAADYSLMAIFETGAPDGVVVINEINYNSSAEFDPGDWVELHNPGSETIDMSNWDFRDHDDDHSFIIPGGTIMIPGAHVVICRDSTLFASLWPEVATIPGSFGFGLSGDGELLRLFDGVGQLHDQVEYDDEHPWPGEPDGHGPTLELTEPWLDNSLPVSWHGSARYGTPGVENSDPGDDTEPAPVLTLWPPFPNPCLGSTKIVFSLERQRYVRLAIYDISGRLVRSLAAADFSEGPHFVNWSGFDDAGRLVASGLYLIQLESDRLRRSARLVLLR